MSATPLKFPTAPGHQVLAAAGKKILRPGGRAATEQLFQWAEFKPDETVLELAASFGESAIAMAKRFGVRVVGVEKNPESVARARENIRAAGLEDRVEIFEGDIFHLDAISQQFDYVLAEAILTMQSPSGKTKILTGIRGAAAPAKRDRLKPGGMFLSHELLARTNEAEIRQTLSEAIRVNATPLSETGWRTACQTAGLKVQQDKTGKMGLLNPAQMLRDEGLLGSLRIGWNVLTEAPIRERVLQMRRAFKRYEADLGYIVFWATVK
jgi:SAM-dependent methyltransferase